MSTTEMSNKELQMIEARKLRKKNQELNNPCLKEQGLSQNCLDTNQYDYDKCESYFENYRTCKKFWGMIMSHRRKEGITPYLPLPEEREKIKAEYFRSQKT
ncbi:coiled-coil-helix-coiled-coil-helix domain-containing protein 7 [Xylocopa sonorina]|uniref:coiled-coil-helix-coiled-coil-helix domain-containing protein 7 n=1 Tax=Xylocopa sonorina TaxID=1818115 RepID=UPI00403AA169